MLKEIEDHKNCYINHFGEVFTGTEGPLKVYKNGCVMLGDKYCKVSTIMLKTFLGINNQYKHRVGWKDGDNRNNSLTNLIVTDSSKIMKDVTNKRYKDNGYKINIDIAREIRKTILDPDESMATLAARYGVSESTINGVLKHKTWKEKD